MKKYLFIFLLIICQQSLAQTSVLIVQNGSSIFVGDSTTISNQGSIQNNGQIINRDSSTWVFNGSALQRLSGNPISFGKFFLANNNGLFLDTNTIMKSSFTFGTGKFFLGNYNCSFLPQATISNHSANNYFVTNGIGDLFQTVGSSQTKIFPVGTINSYLPYTFANNGTADNYSIRASEGSYLKYDSATGNGLKTPVSVLAVNKTWIINEETPGGANFDLTLQWNLADELSGFNRAVSEIRYYNYADSSWQTASAYLAASGSNPFSIIKTISGVSNLKNFPVGVFTVGAPLPVKWLGFEGVKNENDALLNWQTTNSIRNSHFIIQRSSDAFNYTDIAMVKANTKELYSYTDAGVISNFITLKKAIVYYRLKQVDIDGLFTYSKIVSIRTDKHVWEVSAYPNPTTDILNISWTNSQSNEGLINLIDSKGAIVYTRTFKMFAGENKQTLSLFNISKGVYQLSLSTKNGIIKTMQVVKN